MSLNIHQISIVHWYPKSEKHRCGYCKSDNGSISYGMWADTMTVRDYQNLIDRGWRRSGRYCYKPIMNETCCPLYTIRCAALNFRMSKSHKKIVKKFNKYLNDGILIKETKIDESENDFQDTVFYTKAKPRGNFDYKQLNFKLNESRKDIDNSEIVPSCSTLNSNNSNVQNVGSHQRVIEKTIKKPKVIDTNEISGTHSLVNKTELMSSSLAKQGLGVDPNKPPCKKAKLLRLERKQQKMREKGIEFVKSSSNNEGKSLEQFLYDIPETCKNKLKIKLVSMNNGDSVFSDFDLEHQVYKKYQMIIHNDPPEKCSKESFSRFLVRTPLKMTLEKMSPEHKTFALSHSLFVKYQTSIHGDHESDCDIEQFVGFLVDSPLKTEMWDNHSEYGYGSFHQQYWIDDKLVAVGVIDILPKCVSSVYFFYDPDYRSLTLGTYGSLREIDFIRKLHEINPNIDHYYMGFYIHTCPKMRYKGKLVPSDLLCPETYKWYPITECIPKLEVNKYCRFSEDPKDVDEHSCNASDIDRIKIFFDGYVYFKSYKHRNAERKNYQIIGKLVGKKCIETLLFVSQRE